jgi:hypothetical protein
MPWPNANDVEERSKSGNSVSESLNIVNDTTRISTDIIMIGAVLLLSKLGSLMLPMS